MNAVNRFAEAARYASEMHSGQVRKGVAQEPYINHVLDVAARVSSSTDADEETIIAALLHDIIEDTSGGYSDIVERFGERIAGIVMECTDDKTLPKHERKRLQEVSSEGKSDAAKRVKLADKSSNLSALAQSPPSDWDQKRRRDYVDWAERVIAGCRGVDAVLEAGFDEALRRARRALAA